MPYYFTTKRWLSMSFPGYILLLLVATAFTNCDDYRSPVPLSEKPSGPLPSHLLGDWIFVDTTDEIIHANSRLSIYPWHSDEYLVEYCGLGSESDPSRPCYSQRIFVTRLGQVDFVNVQDLADLRDFSFYQYRQVDSLVLGLKWAGDSFKPVFEKTPAFRNYVKKHLKEFMESFEDSHAMCYREAYWSWPRSTEKVRPLFSSAWRLSIPESEENSFLAMAGEELLERYPNESISLDDLDLLFSEYHADHDDVHLASFDGFMDPDPDAFFLLGLTDGSYIKYVTFYASLVDLTNGIRYNKTGS